MKRKIAIIIAVLILAVLVIGGFYAYRQTVDLISDEIEDAKARIDAQDNGSVLEWSSYSVQGTSVEMLDFHYFDAEDNYEIWADRLKVSKRVGENYDGEFDALVLRMGQTDEYRAANGSLENFNTADDLSDFEVEKAIFNGLRWEVTDDNPFILTIDRTEIDNLVDLRADKIMMALIDVDFYERDLKFNAPKAEMDGLTMISSREDYFELGGLHYRSFVMEPITASWYDQPVMQGYIRSEGRADTTGIPIEGQAEMSFDMDIPADKFISEVVIYADKDTQDFFNALELDHFRGRIDVSATLEEQNALNFTQDVNFEELGRLAMTANFSGYQPQMLKDLESFQEGGDIPASFQEFKLENAVIDYQDGILADALLKEFMRVDPFVISFFLQITLPQYFPRDPALVSEVSQSVNGFLLNKNAFTIALDPPQAISLSDILALYAAGGPYKEHLGMVVEGN